MVSSITVNCRTALFNSTSPAPPWKGGVIPHSPQVEATGSFWSIIAAIPRDVLAVVYHGVFMVYRPRRVVLAGVVPAAFAM